MQSVTASPSIGTTGSPMGTRPSMREASSPTVYQGYQIIRRNGAVVAFEPNKIAVALMKAFLAVHGTQGAASASVRETVDVLTEQVVRALLRSRPSGGTFHIEDVQDHVELGLMRGSHHEVARAYVLYRERRTQERARQARPEPVAAPVLHVLDGTRRVPLDMGRLMKEETGSIRQLFEPGLRLPLFLGVSIAVLSQLTGINVIIYYGPKIFAEAGFKMAESLDSQVIIGIMNVVATIFALWKIDHFGRKPLLITGVIGMMISLLCIAGVFFTGSDGSPLLVVCILVYVTFFAFSFGCVTWTLLSEIYPTHIRGRAMSIATLSLWCGTFVVGQAFPWLLETLGGAGVFVLFAVMCIPAIIIAWKFLPETKGKTLEEIERFWLRKAH